MAPAMANLARGQIATKNWKVELLRRDGRRLAGDPAIEIGKCALGECALARERLGGAASEFTAAVKIWLLGKRRKQTKIHIHGLE